MLQKKTPKLGVQEVKKHLFQELLTRNALLYIYKTEAFIHKQRHKWEKRNCFQMYGKYFWTIWTIFNHPMQLKHYKLGKNVVQKV